MGGCCRCFPSKNKRVLVDPPADQDSPDRDKVTIVPCRNEETLHGVARSPPGDDDEEGENKNENNEEKRNLKVFIVFYSMYGHVEILAMRVKLGVDSVDGVKGFLFRVPETLSAEALGQMRVPSKEDDDVPLVNVEALAEADGLLFGFPTRFGSMAAQMMSFFDGTESVWAEQRLAGKPAGFFVSTGTQGGGQETTAWTAVTQLTNHGMIYVPIGYTFGSGMFGMDVIRGGSPYGSGVFSGDGSRVPSETELALAEHHGKYMASIVRRFGPVPPS
ncbi:hypothetical protein SAY87_020910 [Trapa incisa]|uniref:NAD(P)H dehydrogenase (quinone) n=1 Tax=Trapa incisa TaxID=236973 RepID=A0AAN7JR15_9MYRT|nr:hypothetical protein SAY87_020910 [Trapa incisa]